MKHVGRIGYTEAAMTLLQRGARFLVCVLLAAPAAAEPPRGSITIDRISQIKYPSAPAW